MSNFDKNFTLRALESLRLAKRYKKNIFETEIKPFLGKRVMEVGSGIGIFARYIVSCNPEIVVLTDVEEMFLKILKEKFESSGVLVRKLDINGSVDDEIFSLNIDTVIANHVIEHTNDEVSLENISKILVPGGKFILRVPAFNFLYNKIDKRFGHIRRYTKKEITEKIRKQGFEILVCAYRDAPKIIPWVLFGFSDLISDMLFYPKLIKLMDMIYGNFRFIFDLPLPFGADIYCVARKLEH